MRGSEARSSEIMSQTDGAHAQEKPLGARLLYRTSPSYQKAARQSALFPLSPPVPLSRPRRSTYRTKIYWFDEDRPVLFCLPACRCLVLCAWRLSIWCRRL